MPVEHTTAKNPENTTRASQAKKFNTTIMTIQSIILLFGFISGAISLYHYVKKSEFSNQMKYYLDNFPHENDLSIRKSMGRDDFIIKYGISTNDKLDIIEGRHRSELNYYNAKISKNNEEIIELLNFSAILIFITLIIEFIIRRSGINNILKGKSDYPPSNKNDIFNTLKDKLRPIVTGREGLTGFSVADELLKWTALRDNGTVSEEEYQSARKRLLRK